jgi:hypothetical protein
MTDQEFNALVTLIKDSVRIGHKLQGREYDQPFVASVRNELTEAVDAARRVLVTSGQARFQSPADEEDAA